MTPEKGSTAVALEDCGLSVAKSRPGRLRAVCLHVLPPRSCPRMSQMQTLPSSVQPTTLSDPLCTATPRTSSASDECSLHVMCRGACRRIYSLYQSTVSSRSVWSQSLTALALLNTLSLSRLAFCGWTVVESFDGRGSAISGPSPNGCDTRRNLVALGASSKHFRRQSLSSRARRRRSFEPDCTATRDAGSRTASH